jgi:hypothetical protein
MITKINITTVLRTLHRFVPFSVKWVKTIVEDSENILFKKHMLQIFNSILVSIFYLIIDKLVCTVFKNPAIFNIRLEKCVFYIY